MTRETEVTHSTSSVRGWTAPLQPRRGNFFRDNYLPVNYYNCIFCFSLGGILEFLRLLKVHATIACQISVLMLRAKMTQVERNETSALKKNCITPESVAIVSNSLQTCVLSLWPKKYDKNAL